MTYDETLHYLYTSVPVFQHSGASAYKPGLQTSQALDDHLGNPHTAYKTIHVAGTNGKGSVSHLLAAILQQAGYKVGLYTSPHLVDFRERIRVNGQMVPKEYVTNFVASYKEFFEPLHPSFFELTSTMAFDYFRHEQVEYAIIETGLGGRLDSTNIITPILSIITNISADHKQFLGETLPEIAREKAGIIKPEIPVLIGETYYPEVKKVFEEVAARLSAPLAFAQEMDVIRESYLMDTGEWYFSSTDFGQLFGQLSGVVQCRNATTVLAAIRILIQTGVSIEREAVREGFEHVVEITGLRGRWETIHRSPTVICDTGHNEGAWDYLSLHLEKLMKLYDNLHIIIGMANDKEVDEVLDRMPQEAMYYYTQASVPRAMPAAGLSIHGAMSGKTGFVCDTVEEAVRTAFGRAGSNDLIFIGGSTFVVADALTLPVFNTPEKQQ
ncbi:MAG: bifunctional folylpolyglutamate synthase/dihydrofolate synthase [Tannerellaceae bacterium]|nr:bifunctional folylpolyglutamate synthase/dihydrofolate synthase [Tannerellaceae bacterium]